MRKLRHEEIRRAHPAALAALPRHPISVVLDNVRSLYNVGAIFRTSDAVLVEKLYLTGITGTPDQSGLHKTALGSQDTVAWEYVRDPAEAARRLRAEGYTLAVLEITDSPTDPAAVRPEHFPLGLIVGHEVDGVRDELVALADLALEVPQYGVKQSLNVAVAYGVCVSDLVRRYRSFGKNE